MYEEDAKNGSFNVANDTDALWPRGCLRVGVVSYISLKLVQWTPWAVLPHRFCACAVLLALRSSRRIVMATTWILGGGLPIADGRVDVHHIMLFQAMLFTTLSILPNRGLWHISSIPHALCISAMGTVAFWPLTWLQEVNALMSRTSGGHRLLDGPAVLVALLGLAALVLLIGVWRRSAAAMPVCGLLAAWTRICFGPVTPDPCRSRRRRHLPVDSLRERPRARL